MGLLALFGLSLGATLGLRLRVLVLAPAIGLALPMSGAAATAQGGAVSTTLAFLVLATALQLGYLGGAVAGVAIRAR